MIASFLLATILLAIGLSSEQKDKSVSPSYGNANDTGKTLIILGSVPMISVLIVLVVFMTQFYFMERS